MIKNERRQQQKINRTSVKQLQAVQYTCDWSPQSGRERRKDRKKIFLNNGQNIPNLMKNINPKIQKTK